MVEITIPHLPNIEIDDDAIAAWIEGRLDDAHELFIRQMSRGRGGGRIYRRPGRTLHYASAPGEYPVTDSGGRLVGSVHPEMTDKREGQLWSDVQYAGYLTSGTERMEPRRMLEDVINDVLAQRPESDQLARCVRIA